MTPRASVPTTAKTKPKTPPSQYHLTVLRDTELTFPDLFLEIYVEGDAFEQKAFAEMFVRSKCQRASKPEKADIVVFTGGSDVNPALYGEDKHWTTHFNPSRDKSDMELYNLCLTEGIPMFGVCRGAQFLHVMQGGKLIQDINNHVGDHGMWDVKKQVLIPKVSSVHHQSVVMDSSLGMELIGDTHVSTKRNQAGKEIAGKTTDVEAYFYRDTCCFGVQGHPEYKGYHQYMQWCLKYIEDLIAHNPDLENRGNNRRIKQSLIDERNMLREEKKKELN